MSSVSAERLMTLEEFAKLPPADGKQELARGVVITMPPRGNSLGLARCRG